MQIGSRILMDGTVSALPMVPVEYLESDGNQWIDTGVYPTSKTTVSLYIQRLSATASQQVPIGSRSGTGRGVLSDVSIFTHAAGDKIGAHYMYGNGYNQLEDSGWNACGSLVTAPRLVTLSPYALQVDGNVLHRWSYAESRPALTSAYSMGLFCTRDYSQEQHHYSMTNRFVGRIYACRIWNNEVLVRDFIPGRFKNEQGVLEGAMYDRVSRGIAAPLLSRPARREVA